MEHVLRLSGSLGRVHEGSPRGAGDCPLTSFGRLRPSEIEKRCEQYRLTKGENPSQSAIPLVTASV